MDQLIITRETVRQMRKDLARLQDEIHKREDEVRVIQRKLEAIALLMPDVGKTSESNAESTESLPDAIRDVVRKAKHAIKVAEIRERLLARGISATRFGTNSSYLYTALRRLVEQGELTSRKGKSGKSYRFRDATEEEAI
jgi:septal ring factor EnvC (AmiA/AmiB activator)